MRARPRRPPDERKDGGGVFSEYGTSYLRSLASVVQDAKVRRDMSAASNAERAQPPQADTGAAPGRRKGFKFIAWFMAISAIAFGLFTAIFAIVDEAQEIHAVHNAVVAALLMVISAPPAIAAARSPWSRGRRFCTSSRSASPGRRR